MSYRPTDTSEKALVAPIMAELTGRTGSDTPHAGEVREYMPCGGSADMSTEQAGEEHWTGDIIFENEWQSFRTKKDRELKLKCHFTSVIRGGTGQRQKRWTSSAMIL